LLRIGPRVIVVTASSDPDLRATTLEQGASGIIDKGLPFTDLLAAVVAAARGDDLMTPLDRMQLVNLARRARDERAALLAPFAQLTDREARVLRALSDGRPVSSIARGWVVSEATVRSQVRAVLTKLGVSSQLEAVALAHRSGWR
ncbi:MAG TPA: LuxR C-terminal-related transcriptional regulator, partial [Actinomycetota bacterium]|nr:LuxR C-terminal-related transcriptional regulator [Actinomycetota bacterium]